jgi:hypothetical protein
LKQRNQVLILISLLSALNYLDRVCISVLWWSGFTALTGLAWLETFVLNDKLQRSYGQWTGLISTALVRFCRLPIPLDIRIHAVVDSDT